MNRKSFIASLATMLYTPLILQAETSMESTSNVTQIIVPNLSQLKFQSVDNKFIRFSERVSMILLGDDSPFLPFRTYLLPYNIEKVIDNNDRYKIYISTSDNKYKQCITTNNKEEYNIVLNKILAIFETTSNKIEII